MTKLINALDKKCNNSKIYRNEDLCNNNRKRKNIINDLLRNYNRDFYNQNSEPLLKNIIFNLSFKKYKLYIEKENVTINKEINNFEDIIELLNNYPLVENANFNINLDKLHQIKNEIIELNNIIGNSDIKNNILNQILFYLQNFHINTGINYMHTYKWSSRTGKTEIAKIIGKIFSKLGILKNGTLKVVRQT